ncbi:MAG: CCA tRNA nucleotidyltransferase [Bacteriovoracaceae bacterium]|nr:CCA tRNA nucleotidyltransferase [Bacteriovoracaceae bacterium]
MKGFTVTLVGGAVRDFLISGELSKDLDFELGSPIEISSDDWITKIDLLKSDLKSNFKIENLAFHITRLKLNDFELEFSSSRLESYEGDGPFAHSDLNVSLNPNIDFLDSVKRRDFTLNAIGVKVSIAEDELEYELIDPLKGSEDLSARILRECGDNFYKDPVRMLRAIRFKHKLNLSDENIRYSEFNLSKLNSYWFLEEANKLNSSMYFDDFYKLVNDFNVQIPKEINEFSCLKGLNQFKWNHNLRFLALEVIIQKKITNLEDYSNLCIKLKLPKKFIKSSFELIDNLTSLDKLNIEKIKMMSLEDFSTSLEFNIIKKIHSFISQFPDCESTLLTHKDVKEFSKLLKVWPLNFKTDLEKKDLEKYSSSLRSALIFKSYLK